MPNMVPNPAVAFGNGAFSIPAPVPTMEPCPAQKEALISNVTEVPDILPLLILIG